MRFLTPAIASASCAFVLSSPALSEERKDAPKQGPAPDAPPLAEGEKRAIPDYDGRGDEPTTPGDVLIWIPRVVFSPLYLVSEFVVRRPLGLLVTAAEKNDWPTLLIDFFTFGPNRTAGIVPTFYVDFGFRPSVGLYFFWDDFLAKDNQLRFRAAYGGPRWLMLNFKDGYYIGEREIVAAIANFTHRPDYSFWGLGPRADFESRFQAGSVDVKGEYEIWPWRRSFFRSYVGYRTVSFDGNTDSGGDPSLNQAVAAGELAEPPGFDTGYDITYQGVKAALDTRPLRELMPDTKGTDYDVEPGSGVHVEVRAEQAVGVTRAEPAEPGGTPRYHWLRYGGVVGGYWDVSDQQRTIGLWLGAEFVDPLVDGGEIPFSELISLGGMRPLRGFRMGRLLDRSAVVANLEYHWPIWVFLDGAMDFTLGNVFGEHLSNFELGLLRGSYDIGFRGVGATDHFFEVLFGFATAPIDEGFEIESFRFVAGATSLF